MHFRMESSRLLALWCLKFQYEPSQLFTCCAYSEKSELSNGRVNGGF